MFGTRECSVLERLTPAEWMDYSHGAMAWLRAASMRARPWFAPGTAACGLLLLVAGCSSHSAMIGPRPPRDFQEVGWVGERACGFLLFGVIPIRMSSRTARAYAEASRAAERRTATALANTGIQYQWWLIPPAGELHCTVIEGTAVR